MAQARYVQLPKSSNKFEPVPAFTRTAREGSGLNLGSGMSPKGQRTPERQKANRTTKPFQTSARQESTTVERKDLGNGLKGAASVSSMQQTFRSIDSVNSFRKTVHVGGADALKTPAATQSKPWTQRSVHPLGSRPFAKDHTKEISEFVSPKDILESTERAVLAAHPLKGHPFVDTTTQASVADLKRQGLKTIQANRGFLVRKNTLPFEGIDMKKEKYIEIFRRPRKGSADQGPAETPEERPVVGSAKGGNVISQQVINFFTHIKDPEILRAIDDRFEEHTRVSLLRGDVAAVVGQMEDTTSLVTRILDTIGGTDEDVSTEHLAIFAEIARYKIQYIQSTYSQLAASVLKGAHKGSASGTRMSTESQGIQRLQSVSGSLVKVGTNPDDKSINYSSVSLGNKGGVAEGASWHLNNKEDYLTAHPENMKLDLSYFMKALAAQVEYFVAKLNMYRWKETSTEDQVSDLYRRYVEHRTSLKIKSQVKSFGQMIDQIEGVMEDWIRQISQLEIDSQHQQSQINGLKEIITELNQTQEKSRKNIMDLQDQLKKQIGPDIIQARREFEKNFASVSQAMKEEVVRAQQDKEALAVKVTELEAKISVFNLEKLKRESKNQSKEVQAIFQIGAVKESRQMLTDTINAPELAVAKGDGNSKNWLCAIMNHVLNARLAFELDQSKARQKVSTTSMKSFVIEALLVKFGSAQATETLLRDLIACIKKFSGEGERFKLFARFLGAEDILTQEMVRRKKANKYEEFLTQYYYTSHLAVRDYLEFCLLVKGFEYHEDMNTLKPFISFPVNKRSHLLKVDIARKIYVAFIINKEQKQLLDPEVLEEEFDNLLKEDLYDRLHEKGKEIKTKNVRNEEFYLSVDGLSRVLLERRLNQFMSFIQRFLSALTINSAARGEKNLFYDDLQYSCKMVLPSIGEGLIGHIFREIADTPQLQAYSLEKMIQSAVPTLVLINEADQPFNLLNLVITPEDNDQRNFLLREAEVQIEAKIKKNTAKKEGSRFAALIEGLSAFNERIFSRTVSNEGGVNQVWNIWKQDNITNIACLQETYEKIKRRLDMAEKIDDTVALLHTDIKEFLAIMPDKLVNRASFEDIQSFTQAELSEQVDQMWRKLRRIICMSYYHNGD